MSTPGDSALPARAYCPGLPNGNQIQMKDLLVIIPASYVRGTMKLYLWQLEQAGIDYRIVAPPAVGNLGYRIWRTRECVSQAMDYEVVVCSDAFDVTFFGTKLQVMVKIPAKGVLHAAERNCWPKEIRGIPGNTPWRYANGGLTAGTPENILEWCNQVEEHPDFNPYMCDQEFFNRRLAENSPLCMLDSQTHLFFCLFKGYEELGFDQGHPVNRLCDTRPNFIHANGSWETGSMWAMYLESIHAVHGSDAQVEDREAVFG